VSGTLTIAACRADGALVTPRLRTVFRAGLRYHGMLDTEIRGFTDGDVKFERNVATQYHVRIGCEGSKPTGGRYEVMRVLERWDVSALPPYATVETARLILVQEDTGAFPHRYALRWPVDFLLHEVVKSWGPGRGGVSRDNQSLPERGDAWWRDARAGELPWQAAGCGFASDSDPRADRRQEPLAWARLESPAEDLVFTGPRLARQIERAVRERKPLDLILAASAMDEALPGSVKTFFSREFGDDWNPARRPRLEVEWRAPAAWIEERQFVLTPGESIDIRPGPVLASGEEVTIAVSAALDGGHPASLLHPEAFATGFEAAPGGPGAVAASPGLVGAYSLEVPLTGAPRDGFAVTWSAAVHAVTAGEPVSISILETWTPDVEHVDKLKVQFLFTAPSGRTIELAARHRQHHLYECEFTPDELGAWSFSWRTQPDRRFQPQEGSGLFAVVRAPLPAHLKVLAAFTAAAVAAARGPLTLSGRRRSHFRLTSLAREIHLLLRTEASGSPELTALLDGVRAALAKLE
jgi:hypothetical protein